MRNKSKAFSLLEVLIASLLISVLAMVLLPVASTGLDHSKNIKDLTDTTFILQEKVETNRHRQPGFYKEELIRGKKIEISVEKYENHNFAGSYKKIRASCGDKSFELIEDFKWKRVLVW